MWLEFGNLRIVIYIFESRIFLRKIEKLLKLYLFIMIFRKIFIYFDLREGVRKKKFFLGINILFYFFFDL